MDLEGCLELGEYAGICLGGGTTVCGRGLGR